MIPTVMRAFALILCCLAGCTNALTSGTELSLAQHYDKWCRFRISETATWQFVSAPKSAGLPMASAYAEGLYYQHPNATMLILCQRKTSSLVEAAQFHMSNLAHDYTSLAVLSKEPFQFQQAPAIWFLHRGTRKNTEQVRQGYVIIADRGQANLIISLSATTPDEARYAPAFRDGTGMIKLR